MKKPLFNEAERHIIRNKVICHDYNIYLMFKSIREIERAIMSAQKNDLEKVLYRLNKLKELAEESKEVSTYL